MTILSHSHRYIFLKSRKTAGTSVEKWLSAALTRGDIIATAPENLPLPVGFWDTSNSVTRWRRGEKALKRIFRYGLGHPQGVLYREHMTAEDVRAAAGSEVWESYTKYCIERDPWDRLLSFWTWRQRRDGETLEFDAFLDLIENQPETPLVRGFSNLPIYTIDGRIVVDHLIPYQTLREGLAEMCRTQSLPLDPENLPFQKAGLRASGLAVRDLTEKQIARVSRLCAREIEIVGWDFAKLYG